MPSSALIVRAGNVSRYGRKRTASSTAKMIARAWYEEEGFASGWHAYMPLAEFMWNNYYVGEVRDDPNCWCLTGNKVQ